MSNHPPTNATDAAISPEPTYPPCKRARVTTSDKGNATTWSEPATLAYCTACQSVQPVIIQETESEEPISVASTSGQAAEAHNPASESNDATGIQSAQPFENHEAAPEGHDTIASPLARFAVIHDPSRQNDEPQAVNTQSVEPAVAQEPQPEDDGSTIIEDSDNEEFNAWHFPLPEDDDMLEADTRDSAFGDGASVRSDTTSITSRIYRGVVENGRRYQALRDVPHQGGSYPVPSDERQFESMESGHLMITILESQQRNPFFRSPISENAQHILDLGCGQANWSIDVADMLPNVTVHGVDLYPPPHQWCPPNCLLDVDDITKPWLFNFKADLIHLRFMLGSFTFEDWDRVYARAYDNIQPGGWIEHVDFSTNVHSDDGSLPPDSLLAGYGPLLIRCGERSGNVVTIWDEMRERIEKCGFVNINDKVFKMPIGQWAKHPVYKDAGLVALEHFKTGIEGWLMWLLTKYGEPTPWSPAEVHAYVAKMRQELESGWHIYQHCRRVWAQKPWDAASTADPQQPEVVNLAEAEAAVPVQER